MVRPSEGDNLSGHAYTEDQLIEQPAIGLFATLGWQTELALEEIGLSPLSFGLRVCPARLPGQSRHSADAEAAGSPRPAVIR